MLFLRGPGVYFPSVLSVKKETWRRMAYPTVLHGIKIALTEGVPQSNSAVLNEIGKFISEEDSIPTLKRD